MDQMDLSKVRRVGVLALSRQMLDGGSSVRITRNSYAGYQVNRLTSSFRKPVLFIGGKMNDRPHAD